MPEDLPITSFRTWQAVADLRYHAKALSRVAEADLAKCAQRPAGEIRQLLDELLQFGCVITNATLPLHEALEVAVWTPDQPDSFAFALCVLLADLLQQGLMVSHLDQIWQDQAPLIRSLPQSLRAALSCAFTRAVEVGCFELAAPPSRADRQTEDASVLLKGLRVLANGMSKTERERVAQADYGYRASHHLEALNAVIDEQDCLFIKGQVVFPSEVIELVAHVPSETGYHGCIAILMINAMTYGDTKEWLGFRWERQCDELTNRSDRRTQTLLRAFRYCYESDDSFLDYHTRNYDPGLYPGRLIPIIE